MPQFIIFPLFFAFIFAKSSKKNWNKIILSLSFLKLFLICIFLFSYTLKKWKREELKWFKKKNWKLCLCLTFSSFLLFHEIFWICKNGFWKFEHISTFKILSFHFYEKCEIFWVLKNRIWKCFFTFRPKRKIKIKILIIDGTKVDHLWLTIMLCN